MKKKLIKAASVFALVAAAATLPSCNPESLTNLGENPNAINNIYANYAFTGIVSGLANGSNGDFNQGMQYTSYYKDVPDIGGKQYAFAGGPGFGVYNTTLNSIKQLNDVLTSPDDVNKLAINKIIKVWTLHYLTDGVGDIPYSEANKGLDNLKPKYDTQQEVYNQMFADLDAAATAITTSKPSYGTADVLYGGDLVRWKKFAYTIMLRLAMHLSTKDAATASKWAKTAIAGGVMTADADMAVYTKFTSAFTNGRAPYGEYSNTQDGDNSQGAKMSKTWVDQMKNTKDPRLAVIAVVWKKSGSVYVADTNAAVQKGMIPGGVFGKPGPTTPGGDFDSYSEYSPLWWNRDTSPSIILSNAEAYFLTAEAIARGFVTGDAKAAYENGVKAAMRQWKLWPNVTNSGFTFTGNITDAQINSYLLNGYPWQGGSLDNQIKQIMTQRWISLMGDDLEVWTSWRRTGYPAFKFKNWSGVSGVEGNLPYTSSVTGGEMFRRRPYPDERATNNDNQQAALARQGFPLDVIGTQSDLLLGRVWWDKP